MIHLIINTVIFGLCLFTSWGYVVNFVDDSMRYTKTGKVDVESCKFNFFMFLVAIVLWMVLYYRSH